MSDCQLLPINKERPLELYCECCLRTITLHRQPKNPPQWACIKPCDGSPGRPLPRDDSNSGGPGTELKLIFESLGITASKCGGGCEKMIGRMNRWGVDGCRLPENYAAIIKHLRDGKSKFGTRDKIVAAMRAGMNGLAWKIDWSDPFPGLVDEAIRRAETNS